MLSLPHGHVRMQAGITQGSQPWGLLPSLTSTCWKTIWVEDPPISRAPTMASLCFPWGWSSVLILPVR